MAVKRVIEINADVINAQKKLEDINGTLNEQRQILIELERELIEAERIQNETSKSNFFGQKKATDQVKHLKEAIKDQKLSLRELNGEQRQATLSLRELTEGQVNQSKVIKLLDTLTGGYATKTIKVFFGLKESITGIVKVTREWAITQKIVTALQRLWNTEILANPIVAIVAGVIALTAAGAALVSWFISSTKEAERQSVAVGKAEKALAKQTETLESNAKAFERKQKQELAMAKASGASAEAIRKLELKLIDEKIAYEKSERAIARNTVEKNRNILASLRAAEADEDLIKRQVEVVNESVKQYKKQNEDVTKALDEKKDIQNRHLVEIKTEEVKAAEDASKRAKEHAQRLAKQKKEADDKAAKDEADRLKNIAKLRRDFDLELEKADSDYFDSLLTKRAKDEQDVNDYYFRLIETAREYGINTELLETARQAKLEAIAKPFEEAEAQRLKDQNDLLTQLRSTDQENEIIALRNSYEAKFELAKDNAELTKELEANLAGGIAEIRHKFRTQDEQDDIESQNRRIAAVKNGFSIISDLAFIFAGQSEAQQKKAFEIQKAAAIASGLIDTYASAIAAYRSLALINPVLAAVAAGAATTAGLANVKKISQQQFRGASVGGGAKTSFAPTDQGLTQANFNVVGDTNFNQLDIIKAQIGQPIKAFVVGGEVTTQQALDRNKLATATL